MLDKISALIDNQLYKSESRSEIETQINSDPQLRFEYEIQLTVKNTIKSKCHRTMCPAALRAKILEGIQSQREVREPVRQDKPSFFSFMRKPVFAFPSAIAAVLVVYILVSSALTGNPDLPAFDAMAQNNFKSILEGNLKPQMLSSSPAVLADFFREKGVDYEVHLPDNGKWDLVGGVVSKDGGRNLAHFVMKSKTGGLIYVFEISKKYLTDDKVLRLDSGKLAVLNTGNCYTKYADDYCLMVTKTNDNYIAIATNCDPTEIKSYFCSIK